MRDQVIRIAMAIGVPVHPKLVVDSSGPLLGCKISAPQLSALLTHGEAAAYASNSLQHSLWICPSLTTMTFLPLPQLITVSAWPLEQRLVGARTLRVIHLKTLLAFVSMVRGCRFSDDTPEGNFLSTFLRRYAETVTGASEPGKGNDLSQIRSAADEELQCIEPDDIQERVKAAEKLKVLSEEVRYWGQALRRNRTHSGGRRS